MDIDAELRKLPVEGYIWLNVRATNTEPNVAVHRAFKSFAQIETDDNYTQAIKKLLEYYQMFQNDSQYEELAAKVELLTGRIENLEAQLREAKHPQDDDEAKVF